MNPRYVPALKNYKVLKEDNKPKVDNKTVAELKTLLQRQEAIINDRRFMNTLPDKGLKVISLRDKIVAEIKNKEILETTKTISLLTKLSLGDGVGVYPRHPTLEVKYGNEMIVNEEQNDKLDLYSKCVQETFDDKKATPVRFKPHQSGASCSIKKDEQSPAKLTGKKKDYYQDTILRVHEAKGKPVQILNLEESLKACEVQRLKDEKMKRLNFLARFTSEPDEMDAEDEEDEELEDDANIINITFAAHN